MAKNVEAPTEEPVEEAPVVKEETPPKKESQSGAGTKYDGGKIPKS